MSFKCRHCCFKLQASHLLVACNKTKKAYRPDSHMLEVLNVLNNIIYYIIIIIKMVVIYNDRL